MQGSDKFFESLADLGIRKVGESAHVGSHSSRPERPPRQRDGDCGRKRRWSETRRSHARPSSCPTITRSAAARKRRPLQRAVSRRH